MSLARRMRKAIDSFNLTVSTIKNVRDTLIFGVVVISAAVLGFLRWRPPFWAVALISSLIGLGVGMLLGTALANRRARELVAQTGFRVVEYRMDYALGADVRQHVCTREFTLQATHDDASLFVFEYLWSGRGRIDTAVPENAPGRLVDDARADHPYRRTIIGLNRAYARGEEVTVAVTQQLEDVDGEFEHYLSKIVSDPLRKATLSIEFPVDRADAPVPESALHRPKKPDRWIHDRDLTGEMKRQGNKHIVSLQDPPRGQKIYVRWNRISGY
jgi:hypothetical protein